MRIFLNTLFWLFFAIVSSIFIALVALDIASSRRLESINETLSDTDIAVFNTAEVDGLTVAYRTWGNEENPPMVLIHGFLGSSYDYRYFAEALKDTHYLIGIDLIGFGHSDKPSDFLYTSANQAVFIQNFLSHLDVEDYVLVGHSMGGDIALRLTVLEGVSVSQLVLLAPAGLESGNAQTLPPFFYNHIFSNYYLQRLGFNTVYYQEQYQTPRYFDPMFYFTATIPPKTLIAFGENSDTKPLIELLPSILVDTIIVFGQEDTWVSMENGFIFEEKLINSTFHVIENTGHMPMIESLDTWIADLREFLE